MPSCSASASSQRIERVAWATLSLLCRLLLNGFPGAEQPATLSGAAAVLGASTPRKDLVPVHVLVPPFPIFGLAFAIEPRVIAIFAFTPLFH